MDNSCVIFLKQNVCTSDVSVLKVFDIATKKVLDLTDEEKTEFYYNQFPNSKIKSKKLEKNLDNYIDKFNRLIDILVCFFVIFYELIIKSLFNSYKIVII